VSYAGTWLASEQRFAEARLETSQQRHPRQEPLPLRVLDSPVTAFEKPRAVSKGIGFLGGTGMITVFFARRAGRCGPDFVCPGRVQGGFDRYPRYGATYSRPNMSPAGGVTLIGMVPITGRMGGMGGVEVIAPLSG